MIFRFLDRLRFSKKTIFVSAVLLLCSGIFCQSVDNVLEWTGAKDTNAYDLDNWNSTYWPPVNDGTNIFIIKEVPGGNYPVFSNEYSDIVAKSLEIEEGAELKVESGCVFTINETSSTDGLLINESEIILNADFTVNGTMQNKAGAQINSSSAVNLIINKTFTDSGTLSDNITLSFTGNVNSVFTPNTSVTYNSITVSKTGGTLTFADDISVKDISITACNAISFNGELNCSNDFSCTSDSASVVFKAAGSFKNLNLSGEGSVYKFNADTVFSVSGTFKSLGTSTSSVTLTTNSTSPSILNQATWFTLSLSSAPSQADFNYVTLSYCISDSDLRNNPWASDVREGVTGSTANFFTKIFYWLGTVNSSWTNKSNWSYTSDSNAAPGNAPSENDTEISIVVKEKETGCHPLELSSAVSVNRFTVDEGGEVNFADYDVSTVNGLLNDGKVTLKGTQTISGSVTNDVNSTVEYTGFCSSLPMKTTYNDLIFSDGATSFDTSDYPLAAITVQGDLFINNGATNRLTLSGINKLHGLVAVGFTQKAGIITIDGSGLGTGVSLFSNVECSSLYINGNLILNGNITVRGETSAVGDGIVSFTNGTVTIKDDIIISAKDVSGNLSSVNAASIKDETDGEHSLSINADFICTGAIGSANKLKSLTVNGLFEFYGSSVTTSGNQTYNNGINYIKNQELYLTTSAADILVTGDIISSYSTELNITDSNFTQTVISQLSGFSSINIIHSVESDLSADFSKTTVSSSPSWNFTGSADNQLEINFGSSEIKSVSVNKNGSLKINGNFEQNPVAFLTITKGSVLAGDAVFKAGLMIIGTNGSFVQTGNNNSNEQSFSSITNSGTVEWDSTSAGGTLIINGSVTGNAIAFNKKSVTINSSISLSGIFWDLTIPASASVTNNNKIVVRRNFTIEDGGNYQHNSKLLVLGTDNVSYPSADTGIIADENDTKINLGEVLLSGNSSEVTKTINTDICCTDITLDENTKLVSSKIISVSGNLTDNGSWTGNNTILFEGSSAQIMHNNGSTAYNKIISSGTGSLTVENNLTVTTFENPDVDSGGINFNGTVIIKNDVEFNTQRTVTFVSDVSIQNGLNKKNLTHSKGKTVFSGSDESQINALKMTVNNVEAAKNLIVNSDISVEENSAAFDVRRFVVNGSFISYPSFTLKNSGVFYIADGNNCIFMDSFVQTDTSSGEVMLGGSLISHENASFKKDVYFFGDSSRNLTADSGKTIDFSSNLIFSIKQSSTVTISSDSDAITADNIVLYSGNISLQSSLTSIKDVILLGSGYSVLDTDTGISDEYIYNAQRPGNINPNFNIEDYVYYPIILQGGSLLTNVTLPDASLFGGKITFAGGSAINVGKNFYANGLSLTGNSVWNLNVKRNDTSGSCFLEAFNCTVKNSTVNCTGAGQAMVVAEGCTDGSGNTNWLFEDFKIINAFTVRDDLIRVEVNERVRDSEISVSDNLMQYKNGANLKPFYYVVYRDEEKKEIYPAGAIIGEPLESGTGYYFYISAAENDSWNTDATGTSSGTTLSTDRKGTHKNVIPLIDIPRADENHKFVVINIFGKRLKHYHGNGKQYTAVADKTGPSLIEVHTGQECHDEYNANAYSQKDWDAHNFIEFRYSEKVDFYDNGNKISNGASNVQVTDTFGVIQENLNKDYNGSLTFTGLASIAKGNIYTKKAGVDDKYVNTLYRRDEYSIRFSVAGLVEGTIESGGKQFKKWTGYIENAKLPNGSVTLTADENECVKDKQNNIQKKFYNWNNGTREEDRYNSIVVENTNLPTDVVSDKTYGRWDIYAPEVARLHDREKSKPGSQYEANGVGTGGKLEAIEVHIFDNAANDNGFVMNSSGTRAYWISTLGWCSTNTGLDAGGNIVLTDPSKTYLADIFGGSRPFVSDSATGGGLRYCTYYNQASKFSYGIEIDGSPTVMKEASSVKPGASSPVFQGSSVNRNNINTNYDTQYLTFTVRPEDYGKYDVEQSLEFAYDDENSYITDLAGNLLAKAEQSGSIDRSPPDFDVIIAPIGSKEMYLLFYKKLNRGENTTGPILYGANGSDPMPITQSFDEIIPYCLEIGKLNGSNFVKNSSSELQVDTNARAQFLPSQSNDDFTGIKITLNREVTLEDVMQLYIRVVIPVDQGFSVSSRDPATLFDNSQVTLIQDTYNNYMKMYTAHALSDFAVNAVINEYAYDPTYQDESGNLIENGLYEPDSFAVHDWSASQGNYGTLRVKRPVTVIAKPTEYTGGVSFPSVKMFYTASPDSGSASHQYNSDIKAKKRIWLPSAYTPISSTANTNYGTLEGTAGTDGEGNPQLTFVFGDEAIYSSWNSGNQVSFLYGLYDGPDAVMIYHSLVMDSHQNYFINSSVASPLYALRLENPSDPASFDLWSFRLKGISLQRGGITIMNNVINPKKGEKTVIKLDLKEDSRVNIIVMTLDGAVVTYLNRSALSSGEHLFTWDGKNKNGSEVARGMYFIRFVGSGIDETRKVMVVK